MNLFGLIALVGLIIGAVLALSSITAVLFWACWNYALVAVFPSVPHVSFWQAFGLMILCNIILGAVRKATK